MHNDESQQPPRSSVQAMLARHPELSSTADDLGAAFRAIADMWEQEGCLYLCGNGGSLADAMHISGELLKSYTVPRPLDADLRAKLLQAGPDGELLGQALERGLRAMVLGLNHSLDFGWRRRERWGFGRYFRR